MGLKHYLMADDSFLAFWFREGFEQRFFLFDVKSKTNQSISVLRDDIHGGELPYPMTYYSEGKHFISIISKEQILKENKLDSAQKSNLNDIYQDDIYDYLVIYKLKNH